MLWCERYGGRRGGLTRKGVCRCVAGSMACMTISVLNAQWRFVVMKDRNMGGVSKKEEESISVEACEKTMVPHRIMRSCGFVSSGYVHKTHESAELQPRCDMGKGDEDKKRRYRFIQGFQLQRMLEAAYPPKPLVFWTRDGRPPYPVPFAHSLSRFDGTFLPECSWARVTTSSTTPSLPSPYTKKNGNTSHHRGSSLGENWNGTTRDGFKAEEFNPIDTDIPPPPHLRVPSYPRFPMALWAHHCLAESAGGMSGRSPCGLDNEWTKGRVLLSTLGRLSVVKRPLTPALRWACDSQDDTEDAGDSMWRKLAPRRGERGDGKASASSSSLLMDTALLLSCYHPLDHRRLWNTAVPVAYSHVAGVYYNHALTHTPNDHSSHCQVTRQHQGGPRCPPHEVVENEEDFVLVSGTTNTANSSSHLTPHALTHRTYVKCHEAAFQWECTKQAEDHECAEEQLPCPHGSVNTSPSLLQDATRCLADVCTERLHLASVFPFTPFTFGMENEVLRNANHPSSSLPFSNTFTNSDNNNNTETETEGLSAAERTMQRQITTLMEGVATSFRTYTPLPLSYFSPLRSFFSSSLLSLVLSASEEEELGERGEHEAMRTSTTSSHAELQTHSPGTTSLSGRKCNKEELRSPLVNIGSKCVNHRVWSGEYWVLEKDPQLQALLERVHVYLFHRSPPLSSLSMQRFTSRGPPRAWLLPHWRKTTNNTHFHWMPVIASTPPPTSPYPPALDLGSTSPGTIRVRDEALPTPVNRGDYVKSSQGRFCPSWQLVWTRVWSLLSTTQYLELTHRNMRRTRKTEGEGSPSSEIDSLRDRQWEIQASTTNGGKKRNKKQHHDGKDETDRLQRRAFRSLGRFFKSVGRAYPPYDAASGYPLLPLSHDALTVVTETAASTCVTSAKEAGRESKRDTPVPSMLPFTVEKRSLGPFLSSGYSKHPCWVPLFLLDVLNHKHTHDEDDKVIGPSAHPPFSQLTKRLPASASPPSPAPHPSAEENTPDSSSVVPFPFRLHITGFLVDAPPVWFLQALEATPVWQRHWGRVRQAARVRCETGRGSQSPSEGIQEGHVGSLSWRVQCWMKLLQAYVPFVDLEREMGPPSGPSLSLISLMEEEEANGGVEVGGGNSFVGERTDALPQDERIVDRRTEPCPVRWRRFDIPRGDPVVVNFLFRIYEEQDMVNLFGERGAFAASLRASGSTSKSALPIVGDGPPSSLIVIDIRAALRLILQLFSMDAESIDALAAASTSESCYEWKERTVAPEPTALPAWLQFFMQRDETKVFSSNAENVLRGVPSNECGDPMHRRTSKKKKTRNASHKTAEERGEGTDSWDKETREKWHSPSLLLSAGPAALAVCSPPSFAAQLSECWLPEAPVQRWTLSEYEAFLTRSFLHPVWLAELEQGRRAAETEKRPFDDAEDMVAGPAAAAGQGLPLRASSALPGGEGREFGERITSPTAAPIHASSSSSSPLCSPFELEQRVDYEIRYTDDDDDDNNDALRLASKGKKKSNKKNRKKSLIGAAHPHMSGVPGEVSLERLQSQRDRVGSAIGTPPVLGGEADAAERDSLAQEERARPTTSTLLGLPDVDWTKRNHHSHHHEDEDQDHHPRLLAHLRAASLERWERLWERWIRLLQVFEQEENANHVVRDFVARLNLRVRHWAVSTREILAEAPLCEKSRDGEPASKMPLPCMAYDALFFTSVFHSPPRPPHPHCKSDEDSRVKHEPHSGSETSASGEEVQGLHYDVNVACDEKEEEEREVFIDEIGLELHVRDHKDSMRPEPSFLESRGVETLDLELLTFTFSQEEEYCNAANLTYEDRIACDVENRDSAVQSSRLVF